MRLTIILIATSTLITGLLSPAAAQSDSTHLDLGYLTLKKEFTQQLVIRGTDLEKMPVTNLSDAINVWLYGAYSNPATLRYVVDGNPVADVNVYSIYDIEEVVLVQHAAGLIATAPGQSELVLIRTRRGRGRQGIIAAAQTGLITAKSGNGFETDTRIFHNYYARGYRNLGKIGFGVSANYIRDAIPFTTPGEKVTVPDNWQRWRLNGYFDWRPDTHNLVELTINYTPQQLKGQHDSTAGNPQTYFDLSSGHQYFVLPRLEWRSEWGKGITNDLQGTYLHSNLTNAEFLQYQVGGTEQAQLTNTTNKSYHLWIRDHFTYAATLGGGWLLEPSLNLSFEHFNDQEIIFSAGGAPLIPSLILNPGNYSNVNSEAAIEQKTDVILVAPAIDLSFKGAVDMQAGALIHTGTKSLTGNGRQVYPYGGLTIDLLRLADEHAKNSLKLFGSAASTTAPSSNTYTIEDFSNTAAFSSPFPTYNAFGTVAGPPYGPPPGYVPPTPPAYPAWEAGIRYCGWGGRLELAYTFERRVSTTYGVVQLSNGWETLNYVEWHSSLHHADFRIGVLDAPGVSWKTGVNVTLLRSNSNPNGAFETTELSTGDIAPNPWSWTGGWVNRIIVKDFSAGIDLIYHVGQTLGTGGSASKMNSVVSPNIYFGYRCRFAQEKSLEVFAEGRGLILSNNSDLSGIRKYYTLGGKFTL